MTEQLDSPLSAASMLALAEHEQRSAARRFTPDDRLLYGVWGSAWTIGAGARWLTAGDDPLIEARIASGSIYAGLLVIAFVVTVLHIRRRVSGVRGGSEALGRQHGVSWLVAFGAYFVMMTGLDRAGVEYEVGTLMATSLPVFIVGLMYLAGAVLWDDRLQFGLGIWLTLVSGLAVLAGYPGHYLVVSILGGGGFIACALLATRRDVAP